jgi:hypothetical protein
MYLTSHFGFAAVASGNDLESDVIAFNRNTGMPRQKGAQTTAPRGSGRPEESDRDRGAECRGTAPLVEARRVRLGAPHGSSNLSRAN